MFELTRNNSSFLKGIAILLVIANHIVGKIGHTPGSIFGAIGMSLFFILSGYGLSESSKAKGVIDFWGKKIKNIWLPYILISIPAMFIMGASINDFLLDITLLRPYYCYGWYLQILALFYIVFYFSARIKKEIAYFLVWLTVIILVYVLLYDVAQINALAFFLGICLSKYRNHIKASGKLLSVCAFSCAVVGTLAFIFIPVENGMWLPRLQVIQISMALMLTLLAVIFNATNKMLIWVGTISYELYIVHGWIIDPMTFISFNELLWILSLIFAMSWLYKQIWKKLNTFVFSVKK